MILQLCTSSAIFNIPMITSKIRNFAGGYRVEATPVPIPNTEVKLHIADGTARVTGWESRSLPAFIYVP